MVDPTESRFYIEAQGDRLQGDIYKFAPSVRVARRPILVGRYSRQLNADTHLWAVSQENGPQPADGFKWDANGEDILLREGGRLGLAIVLSHDCEIENAPERLILARVRPMGVLDDVYQEKCRAFDRHDMFPLFAQAEQPELEESFVDFAEITTVHERALPLTERYARINTEVREALSRAFWDYLFHPYQQKRVE